MKQPLETVQLQDVMRVNPNVTLADLVTLVDKRYIQTAAQLTKERRETEDTELKNKLRNAIFWTANLGVFEHNEDGSLAHYIGDRVVFNK